jgi:hypothetical protein
MLSFNVLLKNIDICLKITYNRGEDSFDHKAAVKDIKE